MLREKITYTSDSGKAQRGSTSTVWNKVCIKSFSVRCLVSLAYRRGLISVVTLSVVVPQAIRIFLRNNIPKFLLVSFLDICFQALEILLEVEHTKNLISPHFSPLGFDFSFKIWIFHPKLLKVKKVS